MNLNYKLLFLHTVYLSIIIIVIIIIIIIIIKKGRQRVIYTLSVRIPQPHNTNL